MSLSTKPADWAESGQLHFPFYFAKDLERMNNLKCFHWIAAEDKSQKGSSIKHLDFLVGGSKIDITKGRIQRYIFDITPETTPFNLPLQFNTEYNFDFPVLNVKVAKNLMAVRTTEDTIVLAKLNKPEKYHRCLLSGTKKHNPYNTLAWNLAGDCILAGSSKNLVRLFDLHTMKTMSFDPKYEQNITDICWLNDKYFATSSNGGKIKIWSTSQSNPVMHLPIPNTINTSPTYLTLVRPPTSISSIQDLSLLSATGQVITLWDPQDRQKIEFIGHHQKSVIKMNYRNVANGKKIFSSLDSDGNIVTWKGERKAEVYTSGLKVMDMDCMNGFYGVVGEMRQMGMWKMRKGKRYGKGKSAVRGKTTSKARSVVKGTSTGRGNSNSKKESLDKRNSAKREKSREKGKSTQKSKGNEKGKEKGKGRGKAKKVDPNAPW